MKYLIFLFLLIPFCVNAQTDTSTFRAFNKTFGTTEIHKNVKFIKSIFDVMVITGDSVTNTLNENQIGELINSGNYNLRLESNPDSIQKILMSRVKGLMIFEKRKPSKKASD